VCVCVHVCVRACVRVCVFRRSTHPGDDATNDLANGRPAAGLLVPHPHNAPAAKVPEKGVPRDYAKQQTSVSKCSATALIDVGQRQGELQVARCGGEWPGVAVSGQVWQ
jgi:hypothetical protein